MDSELGNGIGENVRDEAESILNSDHFNHSSYL